MTPPSSTILASNSCSGAANGFTAKAKTDCDCPSQHDSAKSLMKPEVISTESTSSRHYVWHLPDSFDLENLRGIHPTTACPAVTLPSTLTLSLSPFPPRKPTPSAMALQSNSSSPSSPICHSDGYTA